MGILEVIIGLFSDERKARRAEQHRQEDREQRAAERKEDDDRFRDQELFKHRLGIYPKLSQAAENALRAHSSEDIRQRQVQFASLQGEAGLRKGRWSGL